MAVVYGPNRDTVCGTPEGGLETDCPEWLLAAISSEGSTVVGGSGREPVDPKAIGVSAGVTRWRARIPMTGKEFVRLLEGVKEISGGWQARCPAHRDETPSLSVKETDGKILIKCHAGCTVESVVRALRLTMRDLFLETPATDQTAEIVARYPYTDADGNLLYEVVRLKPKTFLQRRPDGAHGWVWGVSAGEYARRQNGDWYKAKPGDANRKLFPAVDRVLYRLPEVITAETVYVVEGEKDANALANLGLVATTNPGGAGKWLPAYTETLAGRTVIIIPDNDPPGIAHADRAASSLYGKAEKVTVLALPDLPEKGDVSDWLAAGNTREALVQLAETTPPWTPEAPERTRLEGGAGTYRYIVPSAKVSVVARSVKLHSDGRLTAILRIVSDVTGKRIPASGAINLAAARTRTQFAADLEKAHPLGRWDEVLENLYTKIEDQEMEGQPWLGLDSSECPSPVGYLLHPLLPRGEPMILYGDGASGKSMFAMLIAILISSGTTHHHLGLAPFEAENVLYCDWERKPPEAKRRLYRLAKGLSLSSPAKIRYRKCIYPLIEDIENVAAAVREFNVSLVIVDSLLPASGGGDGRDAASPARLLFDALRRLDCTTLVIAHHGKDREKGIYGSIFFRNLASSVWRAQAQHDPGDASLRIGLFHEKSNLSGLFPPFGVEFSFDDDENGDGSVVASRIDVESIPTVSETAPASTRILYLLKSDGPQTAEDVAKALGITAATARARLNDLRQKQRVSRAGEKWALAAKSYEEIECPF